MRACLLQSLRQNFFLVLVSYLLFSEEWKKFDFSPEEEEEVFKKQGLARVRDHTEHDTQQKGKSISISHPNPLYLKLCKKNRLKRRKGTNGSKERQIMHIEHIDSKHEEKQ